MTSETQQHTVGTGPAGQQPMRPDSRPVTDRPLVYSCSGCSSAAQMANALAIRLDRLGAAEMSCIAGLGGDVPPLVRLARSGRAVLALDGCPLVCVEATLRRHDIAPDRHIVLSRHGVRKRRHADFDAAEAERLLPLVMDAAAALTPRDGAVEGRTASDPSSESP